MQYSRDRSSNQVDLNDGHVNLLIQCNRGRSLDAFFDDVVLQPDSVKIGLIGCGCSVATEPVAEISHKWNISQVPYTYKVCYRFKSPLSYIITSKMIYHWGMSLSEHALLI